MTIQYITPRPYPCEPAPPPPRPPEDDAVASSPSEAESPGREAGGFWDLLASLLEIVVNVLAE